MKRPHITALVVVAALAAAGSAWAAGRAVTLTLGGVHAKTSAACGTNTDSYSVVKQGSRLALSGTVAPRPRKAWTVLVQVNKCVSGEYKPVWKKTVTGSADGTYRATYAAAVRGKYLAKASYGKHPTVDSPKQKFAVR